MNIQQPISQIFHNVRVPASMLENPDRFGGNRVQDCLEGDLVVQEGRVVGMNRTEKPSNSARMVLPRLTECHVHLDKCHTVSRIDDVGGDLQAAIAAQSKDKHLWSAKDVRSRAMRGLRELTEAGCKAIRSHVDWHSGDQVLTPPLAWDILTEIAQDQGGDVVVQIAPLVGIDDMSDREVAEKLARLIAGKSGVLGCFVYDQANRRDGILQAFRAAKQFGLALDFHVDEGLSDKLDGLRIIAEIAIETSFQGPVLCGHACSLANSEGAALKELLELCYEAGICIASLPSTNLYLQGRSSGTPVNRGITRLHELRKAGIPVAIGTDNVRDAFCPLGRHDPMYSLSVAALGAHLDPPYGVHLPMITTDAERAIGLEATYVDRASINDLLIYDVNSTSELLVSAHTPKRLADILQGADA